MERPGTTGVAADVRRARVAVSVVFAACGAGFATWAARVPDAQQRLALSPGALAVGLFGLAFGSVVALVLAGPLLTVVGSRTGCLAGAGLLCAGLSAVAYAPDLAWFVAALALLGVGNSVLDVAMNAHAALVEADYGRPIFAGFHAFWNVGGLAGSGVAALAAGAGVPVTVHFPVLAAVLVVVAAAALLGFRRGPDPGHGGGGAFARPGRALIPLGVIAFCGFLAEGTVNDWSALLLVEHADASNAVASLGYFAFSLTMIAVRLVADRLAGGVGAAAVVRISALVTVVGFVLAVVVPVPAVGVVAFGVVGLGVAAIVPLAWSAAAQAQPDAPAKAIAAVATSGYLGFLVGPLLVGVLAELVGLPVAVLAAGASTLVVALLAPSLRPRG